MPGPTSSPTTPAARSRPRRWPPARWIPRQGRAWITLTARSARRASRAPPRSWTAWPAATRSPPAGALTHKHTDLKDRFYARVKAQDSIPASETALREQNAELRRKLDDMRAERDEYKQAADALARALNVLTIENDELRRKANRAAQLMGPRPLS